MYMYMHTCIGMCVSTCMCVGRYAYVRVCMGMCIRARMYVDAYMCTYVYEAKGTCLNAHARVYVYVYAYMYRHVCKYVYV